MDEIVYEVTFNITPAESFTTTFDEKVVPCSIVNSA